MLRAKGARGAGRQHQYRRLIRIGLPGPSVVRMAGTVTGDAARRERAASLQRTGVTSSQAASRLGYSDARALRRAARRWEQA